MLVIHPGQEVELRSRSWQQKVHPVDVCLVGCVCVRARQGLEVSCIGAMTTEPRGMFSFREIGIAVLGHCANNHARLYENIPNTHGFTLMTVIRRMGSKRCG